MAASRHVSAPAFSADGSSIWAMHPSGSGVSPSASKTVPSGVCLMAATPSPAFFSTLKVCATEDRRRLALRVLGVSQLLLSAIEELVPNRGLGLADHRS